MSNNKTIWKWLGLLCIHTQVKCPDYSGDPGAWDSDMFQKIEDAGLHHKFAVKVNGNLSVWDALKATPPQKASALAQTIREVEVKG